MFRFVCLWGTPPKLGVVLDETSAEGVPTYGLSLAWIKPFSSINGRETSLDSTTGSLILLTNLVTMTAFDPNHVALRVSVVKIGSGLRPSVVTKTVSEGQRWNIPHPNPNSHGTMLVIVSEIVGSRSRYESALCPSLLSTRSNHE